MSGYSLTRRRRCLAVFLGKARGFWPAFGRIKQSLSLPCFLLFLSAQSSNISQPKFVPLSPNLGPLILTLIDLFVPVNNAWSNIR